MNTPDQILPLTETVTPADEAAVVESVHQAYQAGKPVYPIGGGTSLRYGVRPTQPGLGLSLAELTRVVDYPAGDLTITAEAGITIAALSRLLAKQRQRLPVDVPQADRATLGGVVASSPSGPRRYGWGTMRDYVIGLRAVDGTARAFSGGGRVVKNAAGYDLCRLLTGSLGTLGVITQVTLMVKPMPDTSALVACDVAEFDAAEHLLANLPRTQTLPVAVELLAGPAWQDDPTLGPIRPSGVGRLVVGFEGTQAEVDWMVEELSSQWQRLEVQSALTIRASRCGPLWDRLVGFPASAPAGAGSAPLLVRINVLPRATVALVEQLRGVDPDCSIQAHAGNGVICAALSCRPEAIARMLGEKLRPNVAAAGGRMVVLSWPDGTRLDRQDVWGPPGEAATLMQAIKDRFDPKGLLNPGRFVYEN